MMTGSTFIQIFCVTHRITLLRSVRRGIKIQVRSRGLSSPPPPPPAGACVLEQEKGDPVKRVAYLSVPVQVYIKYCRNYFHYSFNWQAYAIFVECLAINFGISFIEIIFARCFNILKRMLIRYYRHSSVKYLAIKIYLHSCTILHYTVMYIILTFKINHLRQ